MSAPYTTAYSTGVQWQGYGASQNASHCGAVGVFAGVCAISYWSGLTKNGNGASGIAQSGFDSDVVCYWYVVWICPAGYQGWYEYYGLGSPNYCLSISSGAGDTLGSYTHDVINTYYGIYDYYVLIVDFTTGNSCWSFINWPSMGAAVYGQFQSESALNLIGGALPTPAFNFWFNDMTVSGYPADLTNYTTNSLAVPGVSPGSQVYYNHHACSGTGESCFPIS